MINRNRHWGGIAAAIAAVAAFGVPGSAWASNADLAKKYDYTVGDAIAYRMEEIFRVTAGLEAATLVYYDRETQDIVAEILGGCDDVEGAKREVEGYVDAIRENVIGYAKKRHGLTLTDRDITLIYYCDSDEGAPAEVVRRENGVYVTPPDDSGNQGGSEKK
jgi:hypothetical protein